MVSCSFKEGTGLWYQWWKDMCTTMYAVQGWDAFWVGRRRNRHLSRKWVMAHTAGNGSKVWLMFGGGLSMMSSHLLDEYNSDCVVQLLTLQFQMTLCSKAGSLYMNWSNWNGKNVSCTVNQLSAWNLWCPRIKREENKVCTNIFPWLNR